MINEMFSHYIYERDSLQNTRFCLEKRRKLKIAYFGGSVTAGYGASDFDTNGKVCDKSSWRAKTTAYFSETYPDAEIESIYAAIGESGTYLGAYRLYDNVISKSPDLAFIEFAINDTYGGFDRERAALQFETIVRELRSALPFCDIVVLISGDKKVFDQYDFFFPTAQGHADIAEKYNLPLVYMGRALYDRLQKDGIPWDTHYIDGVHPNNKGYGFYFDVVKCYLEKALHTASVPSAPTAHIMPDKIVSKHLLDGNRKMVLASHAMLRENPGWFFSEHNVNPTLSKGGSIACTCVNESNPFHYTFVGTEFAVFASWYGDHRYRISIDGGEWKEAAFSNHNPTTVVSGLLSGLHRVELMPIPNENDLDSVMYIAAVMYRDESKQTVRK